MFQPDRRRALRATAALGAAAMLPLSARAQQAPAIETARILVGFAAGGTTDVMARRLADRLRGNYARTAVVDNRAGAGGRVAIELLTTAAPDGTTLLLTPCSMMYIYPHIYTKLSYDPFVDVTPVSQTCSTVFALGVGPAVPDSVRTVRDFMAFAKANPDKATYGSPAAGSTPHFVGALIERAAGTEIRHVAFRGSQPAIVDMMGGQVSAVSAPVGEFLPHMKTGKVRILATSGAQRTRFAPDVPTFTEQGHREMEATEPYAVFLPGKASPEVLQRANAAVRAAAASPEFAEGIAQMGLEAVSNTPADLSRLIRTEHDRWGPVVKTIGFKADS